MNFCVVGFFAQRITQSFGAVQVAAVHHDFEAVFRKAACGDSSDTTRRAGDQADRGVHGKGLRGCRSRQRSSWVARTRRRKRRQTMIPNVMPAAREIAG